MKLAILITCLIVLYGSCERVSLVSMEMDTFTPLVHDRIDSIYSAKLDFTNNDKDKFYLRNRKLGVYPQVEAGPGSFKAEYKMQAPDFLVHKFKKLLEIKKKMDNNS